MTWFTIEFLVRFISCPDRFVITTTDVGFALNFAEKEIEGIWKIYFFPLDTRPRSELHYIQLNFLQKPKVEVHKKLHEHHRPARNPALLPLPPPWSLPVCETSRPGVRHLFFRKRKIFSLSDHLVRVVKNAPSLSFISNYLVVLCVLSELIYGCSCLKMI